MTRRDARARSGITLVEILISIMILGIGVISLATLFPIGLIRLRNAQRITRGQFLRESAAADLNVTGLPGRSFFLNNPPVRTAYTTASGFYLPYVQDTPTAGSDWRGNSPNSATNAPNTNTTTGVYMGGGGSGTSGQSGLIYQSGQGLPVAYDPLWRSQVSWYGSTVAVPGLYPDPTGTNPEARFGLGVASLGRSLIVRDDPNAGGNATPSAHGLQRVTNLQSALNETVLRTFVSPEDFVLQDPKGSYFYEPNSGVFSENGGGVKLVTPSPLVPSLTVNTTTFRPDYTADWRFTWFFTGQLSNASDVTRFQGSLVVCENRAFGLDLVNGTPQATGERTVEAVWGYTTKPDPNASGASANLPANVGYPHPSARRTVLLRWPATTADPDLKVGQWIADVTYERTQKVINSGRFPYLYPPTRCYWYRVAKRTDPIDDPGFPSDPSGVRFRRVTVWVNEPLRALTPLSFSASGAEPYHVEAGLIMPSVVDVKPVAFQAY